MRIVVVGGAGTVGRHVVDSARGAGHEVVVASRATGVDVISGAGLAAALAGADAVVDVSSIASTSTRECVAFFERATTSLLAAEQAAGVGHHVALSIVGIDGLDSGHYAGKLRQEALVATGPVPWSLLRATQFHEFAVQVAGRGRVGPIVVVPAMVTATVAAAEVGAALATLAAQPPQGRVADLGGPEVARLDSLVRIIQRRPVLALPAPGPAGRGMRSGALLPGPDARRGEQTFRQWWDASRSSWRW